MTRSIRLWRCVFFESQIWRVVKFLKQNLTRFETLNSKSCSLEKHQNYKVSRFHGVNWTITWFFDCKQFFETWHVEKFSTQNLTRCNFQSKIWRFVKLSNQNLTRFEIFISKSDALEKMNPNLRNSKILFSEMWVLSCYSSSDWRKIFSVNVNNTPF